MESPENKKYIFICTGKDCQKNGSKQLSKSFIQEVKAAGLKSAVSVIKTKCMDHCKKGPNVIVNNSLHHKVKEKELTALLDQLKFKNTG